MSYWTHIHGVITVSPMGRTQPEKRYVLDTILAHLPRVTGSEGDMQIYVVPKNGHDMWCSHNEFMQSIPGQDITLQSEYLLVLDADLRDRKFEETLRELSNWLNRLAKRVFVDDVLIKLSGYGKTDTGYKLKELVILDVEPYAEMFEPLARTSDELPSWAEYLLWEKAKNSDLPMLLHHKYIADPDTDAEVNRRHEYHHVVNSPF